MQAYVLGITSLDNFVDICFHFDIKDLSKAYETANISKQQTTNKPLNT